MAETKNSTTKKILRTQRQALNWTMFLVNLLGLCGLAALWLLWHVQDYAGGWELLGRVNLTYLDLYPSGTELWLTMVCTGLEQQWWNVTAELQLMAAGVLCFWILEGLVQLAVGAVWRARIRSHMKQVSQLAREARQLGEEAAKRQARKPAPKVDVLEEAIDQISPTENTRLHIGDPDLKGLEDAVNDLLDRMQAAYSQQTRFVSDASHELRTPIAVLKGYADLLERWGKDDPQVRDEAIEAIQAEAERMSRLVEQLLFLARGDSGRTQLRPEPLDLAALLRESCEEFTMIDPDHRWVLAAPSPVPYTGDRDMLKQAVRILGDNACKYTPAGKTITLKAWSNREGRPCLSVRDEGIGIKKADAPHVFDRFYRSDPARTRRSGGAGLGLAIADWIVTSHGGHLEMYSWEGIGTRFTIVL